MVSPKKNFDISKSEQKAGKAAEQHSPNPERSWAHFPAEFPKETWNEPPCLSIPQLLNPFFCCFCFYPALCEDEPWPNPFLGVCCATHTPPCPCTANTKSCFPKEPPELSQPQTTTRACICSGKQENPSPSCNSRAPQAPPQQTPRFSPKLCPSRAPSHPSRSILSFVPLSQGWREAVRVTFPQEIPGKALLLLMRRIFFFFLSALFHSQANKNGKQ